ncbi:MAG: hypothetical protein AAFV53_32155 [Myxococcota bacterium]
MPDPRPAHPFKIKRGPMFVLALLSVHEVILAMRSAGAKAGPMALKLECARFSLREIDGQKVEHAELVGSGINRFFPRVRHQNQLIIAWGRVHEPSLAEVAGVRRTLSVEVDETTERWSVILPDKRRIRFKEQDMATVEEMMVRARQDGEGAMLAQFSLIVDNLRASITHIDEEQVDEKMLGGRRWSERFSVKDTMLLGEVWTDMQVGGDEDLEALGKPLGDGGTSSPTPPDTVISP